MFYYLFFYFKTSKIRLLVLWDLYGKEFPSIFSMIGTINGYCHKSREIVDWRKIRFVSVYFILFSSFMGVGSILQTYILQTGHFIDRSFLRWDISQMRHFKDRSFHRNTSLTNIINRNHLSITNFIKILTGVLGVARGIKKISLCYPQGTRGFP